MNMPFFLFFKKSFSIAIATILTIGISEVANAQSAIGMDGSTGTGLGANQNFNVPGVNQVLVIKGDGPNANGTQSGSNLFFSFSQFGIAAGDTALFLCPGGCTGVTNVISRVTGGNASVFDGTLVSVIGHANFWFFNPSIVSVNGTINIPLGATYHISNANAVLGSSGNLIWDTFTQSGSTLTSATPASFTNVRSDFPVPSIIIEGTNINSETTISTVVSKILAEHEKPDINIAQMNNGSTLEISKKPCDNRSQSSLVAKGVANYIPELSSQVSTSVLTTTTSNSSATAEQISPLTQAEMDDCQ
jgi:filamentous hemagglutinin family protein